VVLLLAAAVITGGMIVVAVGRGGEMAEFSADVRPLDTDIATAADVALLRPPVALWGYDKRSTDEALNLVARTVTERDVEIATLRRQIADMQSAQGASSAWQPDRDAIWRPAAFPWADAAAPPDDAPPASPSPLTAAAVPLGQPDPGSQASPVAAEEASQATPPAETQPWSAWESPTTEQPPDHAEPADPEQTG
jgi:hypothetical protein